MKLPRWLHKLWAGWNGYFWLPCPLCNKMFAGYEWAGSIKTSWNTGTGVCPDCVDAAKEYNKKWIERNPEPTIYKEGDMNNAKS